MITFFFIITVTFTVLSLASKILLKAAIFSGKIIVSVLKFFGKALFVFIIAAVILFILLFFI